MGSEKMIETLEYPRTTKLKRMETRQIHHPNCTRSVFDFANHFSEELDRSLRNFRSTTIFVSHTASEAFLSWTQQPPWSGRRTLNLHSACLFTYTLTFFCVRAPHRWIWAYRPSPSHSQPAISLDIYLLDAISISIMYHF